MNTPAFTMSNYFKVFKYVFLRYGDNRNHGIHNCKTTIQQLVHVQRNQTCQDMLETEAVLNSPPYHMNREKNQILVYNSLYIQWERNQTFPAIQSSLVHVPISHFQGKRWEITLKQKITNLTQRLNLNKAAAHCGGLGGGQQAWSPKIQDFNIFSFGWGGTTWYFLCIVFLEINFTSASRNCWCSAFFFFFQLRTNQISF